jgi:transcriptional regulator with XRE-family HTH domain
MRINHRRFIAGAGFPQRVIKTMAEQGLTLERVHKETGIAMKTLVNWRQGNRHPDKTLFYKFCQQYKVSPRWLLRAEGEPPLQVREPSNLLLLHAKKLLQLVEKYGPLMDPYEAMTMQDVLQEITIRLPLRTNPALADAQDVLAWPEENIDELAEAIGAVLR